MADSRMEQVRQVAAMVLRVDRKSRKEFVEFQAGLLGALWGKDIEKLAELIWTEYRGKCRCLADLDTGKDPRSPRPSLDKIKIDEDGNYIRHEGVSVPDEVKRQEHSSLTAQERFDEYQIFVVMSVYDDEICEEYQSQDEADIAASRFTKAVMIRRYSKLNGLEHEDWTYNPDNWKY